MIIINLNNTNNDNYHHHQGGGEDGEQSRLYAHALLRWDMYKIDGGKTFSFFPGMGELNQDRGQW